MRDIVIDSILSCKYQLNQSQRKYCFELLGFDFLIDEDFRTWLLEVNNNPFLGIQNPNHQILMHNMMNSLFEIVLEPLLQGPNIKKQATESDKKYKLIYSDY
jgi:hypothetical protein